MQSPILNGLGITLIVYNAIAGTLTKTKSDVWARSLKISVTALIGIALIMLYLDFK